MFIRALYYNIKSSVSSWYVFLLLILLPPVAIALLCAGLGPLASSELLFSKLNVGFCDAENSIYSSVISNILVNDEKFKTFLTIDMLDDQTAMSRIESGELDAAIFLPDNFVADMSIGINRPIRVVCNDSNPLKTAVIKEFMESAAAQITAAQSAINTVWFNSDLEGLSERAFNNKFNSLVMNYMFKAFARDKYSVSRLVSAFGSYSMAHFLIASALSLSVFLICSTCIKQAVYNRSRRINSRLYSGGLGPLRISLAGQLPFFFISFAQTLLILILLKVLSVAGPARELIDLDGITLSAAALTAVAAAAVCFFAASIVHLSCQLFKNTESVEIFSITFIIISAIAGGTVIPYAYLPGFFEKLGVASYSRWTQNTLLSAAYGTFNDMIPFIALLTAVSLLMIGLSAGIIKKDITGSVL